MSIAQNQTIDQADIQAIYDAGNNFVTRWNNQGGHLTSLGTAPGNIQAKVEHIMKIKTFITALSNEEYLRTRSDFWIWNGPDQSQYGYIYPFSFIANYDGAVCRNMVTYHQGYSKSPAETYANAPNNHTTNSQTPTTTYTKSTGQTNSDNTNQQGYVKVSNSGRGDNKDTCNHCSGKTTHYAGDNKHDNTAGCQQTVNSAVGDAKTTQGNGFSQSTNSQGQDYDITNSKQYEERV